MGKPILFNAEMVNAILEGRKTCTRRIVKTQPKACNHEQYEGAEWKNQPTQWGMDEDGYYYCTLCGNGHSFAKTKSGIKGIKPPCQIGDILYVRETWAICDALELCSPNKCSIEHQVKEKLVWYRADGEQPNDGKTLGDHLIGRGRWRPSIHMPRAVARIFLKVNDVRIERLQDISEEDALKEGFNDVPETFTSKELFEAEWNTIYKNWSGNPWVWVIEFERVNQ